MPASTEAEPFRDRVKELRRIKASDLVRNPKNWAEHPPAQRKALKAVFKEIGFAVPNIGYELPDGRVMLIDGEARSDEAADAMIPVAVLDVTPAEADKLLATVNPLGMLLEVNKESLGRLIKSLDVDDAEMAAVYKGVADRLNAKFDDDQPPVEITVEALTPSTTRMVQLLFEPGTFAEFRQLVASLSERYGTDNTTDTVSAALRRATALEA